MFGFHLRSYLSAPIIATFVMSSQDSPSSLFSGTVNHHLAACAAHRYSRIAMAIEAFSKHPSRNTSVTRRRWRIGLALEVVSTRLFHSALYSLRPDLLARSSRRSCYTRLHWRPILLLLPLRVAGRKQSRLLHYLLVQTLHTTLHSSPVLDDYTTLAGGAYPKPLVALLRR